MMPSAAMVTPSHILERSVGTARFAAAAASWTVAPLTSSLSAALTASEMLASGSSFFSSRRASTSLWDSGGRPLGRLTAGSSVFFFGMSLAYIQFLVLHQSQSKRTVAFSSVTLVVSVGGSGSGSLTVMRNLCSPGLSVSVAVFIASDSVTPRAP